MKNELFSKYDIQIRAAAGLLLGGALLLSRGETDKSSLELGNVDCKNPNIEADIHLYPGQEMIVSDKVKIIGVSNDAVKIQRGKEILTVRPQDSAKFTYEVQPYDKKTGLSIYASIDVQKTEPAPGNQSLVRVNINCGHG